jgi:cytosine/adenosine deaminase-related metal-dependent hydrolase
MSPDTSRGTPPIPTVPILRQAFDPARYNAAREHERRMLLKGGTLLTMDPAVGDFACGDLLIEGTTVGAVGANLDIPAPVIDASGMIIMPGFCDPHIHAWQGSLTRIIGNQLGDNQEIGIPSDQGLATRNYTHVMHHTFGPLFRPEDIYIGTLMSLLVAANSGITTVCDNCNNSRSSEHSDASVAAMRDAGIRSVYAFGRARAGAHGGQFPVDAYRLRKQYFASNDQLHTMRLFMRGDDPYEEMRRVLDVRRDLDLWVTFDSGLGKQPVVEMYEQGLLDGRETINHGNFMRPEQMRAVVDHGATVNVCPRIESQFRYGDIPYQAWRDVGLKPGISNDDPATYPINMFQEMRVLYSHQRAQVFKDYARGNGDLEKLATVRDMLEAATICGAGCCGLSRHVGSLTPGKQADLILISTDNIHLFPTHNAPCTLVQGGDVGFVDAVFIAGRVVKWQGELIGVDFARLKHALEESRDYLFDAAKWPREVIDLMD